MPPTTTMTKGGRARENIEPDFQGFVQVFATTPERMNVITRRRLKKRDEAPKLVFQEEEGLFSILSPYRQQLSSSSYVWAFPQSDILFLKHDSRIIRQSSNPVCSFSMMEQVRLCAV